MIDHYAIQLALRTKLLTLSAATTGSASLAATATGYSRSTGSFLTDGFAPGMEITGSGFTASANNAAKTLTAVAALTLTCAGCSVEAAGTRTIAAGLPAYRAWENVAYEPTAGVPYVTEAYLPGPMSRQTLGTYGELEAMPTYVVRVNVPENTGIGAASQYADALLTLFAPGTAMTVGSDTLRVRADVAPFRGQLLPVAPGFVSVSVSVPLRLRTANSI